ncbi:MAG: hypothetical protein FWJ87_13905 [Micromonosporaceae bacterium]|jgi:hypothetical protein
MAHDTAPRTGGRPRVVAAAVNVVRAWGRVLATSAGVAAMAGAAQLGVAYGLQILRFRREFPPGGTWATQLTWVAWIAALAVMAGGVGGVWTAHRLAGGFRRLELGHRIAISLASGVGAALTVALAAVPARQADLAGADPALEAALAALLGLVAGVLAAVGVLSVRLVAVSVAALVAVVWLVALVSVVPTLGPSAPPALVRLGVLDLGLFGEGARRGVAVLSPPLAALVVGVAVAAAARSLGLPVVRTVLSGAAGPVLLALAYLVAPPGGGSDAVQAAAFAGAMISIAAGLLGAVAVVAFRRPRPEPEAGWPPEPYAAGAGPYAATAVGPYAGGAHEPYTVPGPLSGLATPPEPTGLAGPAPDERDNVAAPAGEYGRTGAYGAPAYPVAPGPAEAPPAYPVGPGSTDTPPAYPVGREPDDTGSSTLPGLVTPPPWRRSDDDATGGTTWSGATGLTGGAWSAGPTSPSSGLTSSSSGLTGPSSPAGPARAAEPAGGTGTAGSGARPVSGASTPPAASSTPVPVPTPPPSVSTSPPPVSTSPPPVPGPVAGTRGTVPSAGTPATTPEKAEPVAGRPETPLPPATERPVPSAEAARRPSAETAREPSTEVTGEVTGRPAEAPEAVVEQPQTPEGSAAEATGAAPEETGVAPRRRRWWRRRDRGGDDHDEPRASERRRRGEDRTRGREDRERQRRDEEAPPEHEAEHVDWVRSLAGAQDDASELRSAGTGRRRLRRDPQLFSGDLDFSPELRLPGPYDRRSTEDE